MTDIETLRQEYFVQGGSGSQTTAPSTSKDNDVTVFIDGKNYFDDLRTKISGLGGSGSSDEFLYVHAWALKSDFTIDKRNGSQPFAKTLKAKAKAGVDVRVFGWTTPYFFYDSLPVDEFKGTNVDTIEMIQDLRETSELSDTCCLDTLSHAAGAAHAKIALVGTTSDTYAYTGGIDPVTSRWATQSHSGGNWHDIHARVQGPAAEHVFEFYQSLWNELLDREQWEFTVDSDSVIDYVDNTPEIGSDEKDAVSTASSGTHHVQSLRTLPDTSWREEISFAPAGTFEVADAWEKALSSAETYIYIENYGFHSPDLLDWIAQRLKDTADLKVIFLIGDDGYGKYSKWAIQEHLIDAVDIPELDRLRFFKRTDAYVHSKLILIDDQWMFVGSANMSRRSLYTDIEHGIGVLDENESLVESVRTDLWAEHFSMSSGSSLTDIEKALHVWESDWGTSGVSPTTNLLTDSTSSVATQVSLSDAQKTRFDRWIAPDSREWNYYNAIWGAVEL